MEDQDLHRACRIVEGVDRLLTLPLLVLGSNAEYVEAEDEHEDLHQPGGRRPVAEDNHLAPMDVANLVDQVHQVAQFRGIPRDVECHRRPIAVEGQGGIGLGGVEKVGRAVVLVLVVETSSSLCSSAHSASASPGAVWHWNPKSVKCCLVRWFDGYAAPAVISRPRLNGRLFCPPKTNRGLYQRGFMESSLNPKKKQ